MKPPLRERCACLAKLVKNRLTLTGKNQGGRSDESVQAKRRAAESVVRRLLAIEGFEDHAWGYLIAYGDDIQRSDSWDDLKTRSHPVCNG